jgi:single-strand DNA-binding protein
MASFNKVILIGNLTRDPELRYTPKGMAIAQIGLAVNRTWRNEAGESKEEVTFLNVDAFGKQAELLAQYMKKGSPLFMEGRLKLDQWDDKTTGQKRSQIKIVLEGFQFIGGGQNRAGSGEPNGDDAPPARAPRPAAVAKPENTDEPPAPDDDDVPF